MDHSTSYFLWRRPCIDLNIMFESLGRKCREGESVVVYQLVITGKSNFQNRNSLVRFCNSKKAPIRQSLYISGFSKIMARSRTVILLLLPFILSISFLSSISNALIKGSSLSVENPNHVLKSPDGIFLAGFLSVGVNTYCFAIWFNEPSCRNGTDSDCTVVWMANRDQPVNGKKSEISLLKSGNLVLTDAGRLVIWSSGTVSGSSDLKLVLLDNGNLMLVEDSEGGTVLWQSFASPTDTLLPEQKFTKDMRLVSSRSVSNSSSGFYRFYFDSDNTLRLLFDGPDTSGIYWPEPDTLPWQVDRSTYNSSRIASFDSLGNFSSSDNFTFMASDYGLPPQRRLKLDSDGNLRLYSREDAAGQAKTWTVSWQAISEPCRTHGICGPNSLCSYDPSSGRRCSCLPGFKIKDSTDWSLGCDPEFNLSCSSNESSFIQLINTEFYGYDFGFFPNYTLDMCQDLCLQACDCKGFQLKSFKIQFPSDIPYCFPKVSLLNGHHSPNFYGEIYVKVPKGTFFSAYDPHYEVETLNCSSQAVMQLNRTYEESEENGLVKFMVWSSVVVGVLEMVFFLSVGLFSITNRRNAGIGDGYICVATGFRRFTLSEMKKATRGFSEEIGRGGGGVVFRGVIPGDGRVAAIKRLNEDNLQGEAEFQAEVSTIQKLNHSNLIELWGYCAEGKHRLLVYKYMERGSLQENLESGSLVWEKRFEIAIGTAKGLAYLHEECLEWVLHCDVKPQNILLDDSFRPKVSDFGLSRPLKRGNKVVPSNFSKIRGTRGYMAPEWVSNLPITSKVDVYSYGMVLLEMATGKSPLVMVGEKRLCSWVREAISSDSWMGFIFDPRLEGKYDNGEMETLVRIALDCVNEDRNARPTMSQVVKILLQSASSSNTSES